MDKPIPHRLVNTKMPSNISEDFFNVFEEIPAGLFILDSSLEKLVYINPMAINVLGYTPADLGHLAIDDVFTDKIPAVAARNDDQNSAPIFQTGKLRSRNGVLIDAYLAIKPFNDQFYLIIFHDLFELRIMEYTLEYETTRFNDILKNMPGIFLLFNQQGRLLYWNRNFESVSEYSAEEIANANHLDFIPEEEKTWVTEIICRVFVIGSAVSEYSILTRSKSKIPYLFNKVISNINGTDCLLSVGVDIRERKRSEEETRARAHFDTLTGLPNRTLFQDRFSRSLAYAQRYEKQLALLFIDLDLFKDINDTFGHKMGDRVLWLTAQRIFRCLRESDTVARFGGDEFLVLLPEISGEHEACLVAGKILESLQHPIDLHGSLISISSSIGVAIFPAHGDTEDLLLDAADQAMYESKKAGRNHYHLHEVNTIRPFA